MSNTPSKISVFHNQGWINEEKFGQIFRRLIYVVCFMGLCFIDQIMGTAPGQIQFAYKNYTGIIIAVIILSAYRIKDFIKIPYLVWLIVFFCGRYFVLNSFGEESLNIGELQTNLWGIGIYGIVFIRFLYDFVVEKKKPRMNWQASGFCFLMLLAMVVIRTDYAWPKALLGAFVSFYLTDFDENDLKNIFAGMMDGIILGFLIIQGQAWLHRPYDEVKYLGMYCHHNANGLFYVCVYCAVLSKWYFLKGKKYNNLFRLPYILLTGIIIGTSLFTGSRTTFITLMVLTIVFLLFQFISVKRRRIVECLLDVAVIGVTALLCILPSYYMIRYIPAYIDEPIYFDTNKLKTPEKKILKGDPIDSEKYVEFDEAIEGLFGRYLWFQGKEGADESAEKFKDWLKKMGIILEVEASGYIEGDEVYIEPGSDKWHPLIKTLKDDFAAYDVRLDIYKHFWGKLQLIGEKNNVQGVWIHSKCFAAHCHNVFLQMAYDFGIIVGIMFIIIVVMLYNKVIFGLMERKDPDWYYRLFVVAIFTTAFVVFGQFEQVWRYGQLPFTMFFIVQYVLYHKDTEELEKMTDNVNRNLSVVQSDDSEIDDLEIVDLD